jgi:hypothetical protein
MPRFVLLEHDHPTLHWDLMFEVGEVLWTWRLEKPPGQGRAVGATRIADHRLVYLDYEGPISGNRGVVRRQDRGEYRWLEQSPTRLVATLTGERWQGELVLEEMPEGGWQVTEGS